ncbi:MAG: hypothetical protein ACO3A2_07420 [Bdellovibrionia bacterium]
MKKIGWTIAALMISSSALAGEDQNHFTEHKQRMLQHMDERISQLQTERSCMAGAANQDAARTCRENHRQARRQLESQRIDTQIQNLQQKKEKMNQR